MPTDNPDKLLHLKFVSSTARPARPVGQEKRSKKTRAPAHMTPEGKRAWAYLVPLIAGRLAVEPHHVIPLERMCEVYGEILKARDQLAQPLLATLLGKKTGEQEQREIAPANCRFYETGARSGPSRRERPEYAAIRHATQVLKAYLAEFALTPTDVAGGPAGRLGRA